MILVVQKPSGLINVWVFSFVRTTRVCVKSRPSGELPGENISILEFQGMYLPASFPSFHTPDSSIVIKEFLAVVDHRHYFHDYSESFQLNGIWTRSYHLDDALVFVLYCHLIYCF